MSHFQQLKFIECTNEYLSSPVFNHVLEIGSYDINGSIKEIFSFNNYLGLDLIDGPGVDKVYDGADMSFLPDASFDLVISSECFEHNPHWENNIVDMYQKLRSNCHMLVTCASRGRAEHGTQRSSPESSIGTSSKGWDYYRNIRIAEFRSSIQKLNFEYYYLGYNRFSKDLYFFGKKGDYNESQHKNFNSSFKKLIKPAFTEFPKKHSSPIVNLYFSFLDFPVLISSYLLSETYFQNFQIFWRSLTSKLNNFLLLIYRTLIR